MTILLYLVAIFSNFLFAYRKKHSKVIIAFSFVIILLLVSGAGPSYDLKQSRDYLNYSNRYNNIMDESLFDNPQIGYTLLMKFGNLLNLDFFKFRMIVIGICFFVIYKLVIKRYAYNYNYMLLLYLLYQIIIDSEHFRNFIAMTILLISIRYLEKKSLKNSIKFSILVLLSASFHTAFLAYLVLLLMHVSDRKLLIKIIVIFTILLTVITIINNNRLPVLNILLSITDDDKIIGYLSTKTNLGYLIPFTLHIINVLFLYWSKKIASWKKDVPNAMGSNSSNIVFSGGELSDLSIVNLVLWINIIGIVFFPLFIMNLQFYRLIRNFLILNYAVYSIVSNKLRSGSLYKFAYNFSVLVDLGLWFVLDLTVKTSTERVLIPFFTRNYFFN